MLLVSYSATAEAPVPALVWLRLQFRRAEVLHKQRSQIK